MNKLKTVIVIILLLFFLLLNVLTYDLLAKENNSNEINQSEIIENEDLLNEEENSNSAKKDEIKNIPIETLNSINNDLSKLDITAICRLQGESKLDFIKQLDILQAQISEIKEKINNGIN